MSYIDIMKLTTKNILCGIDGNDWIMAERKKTGIPVKIPILPIIESLIKNIRTIQELNLEMV